MSFLIFWEKGMNGFLMLLCLVSVNEALQFWPLFLIVAF